jgi:membrane protease YdiL (CAAX protease family)
MTAKPNTEDRTSTANVRNVVLYSCAVLAMPIIGEQIGELLQIWRLLELIEAVPAVVCAFFVSRMPRHAKVAMHVGVRAACLIPLFLLVVLGIGGLPVRELAFDWTLAFIFANAIAIGVTEELTFRYSLHRLWSRYGAILYVVLSSLIFGLAHYPGGAAAIGITTALGAIFGLARIAGTPVLVLIVIHGLIDLPEMVVRFAPTP